MREALHILFVFVVSLIAVVHSALLIFGRSYNGHWLVVTGFSSDGTNNYVILDDPDDQQPKPGYPNWIVGGKEIQVLLSIFQKAEKDGAAGPYGIIVTS